MNKLLILILLSFLSFSCKSFTHISFCELVDSNKKGINCGKVFTTGDLIILISHNRKFLTDTLKIIISKDTNGKFIDVSSLIIKVNPHDNTALIDTPFDKDGIFKITVYDNNENIIAEKNIKIVDE